MEGTIIFPSDNSTATGFIIFRIADILQSLQLSLFWVALRSALMLVVDISFKIGMLFLVLTSPRRQCVAPSHLLEMRQLRWSSVGTFSHS
jgi:hypothetical protein